MSEDPESSGDGNGGDDSGRDDTPTAGLFPDTDEPDAAAGNGDGTAADPDDPFAELEPDDGGEATDDELEELFDPVETTDLDGEAVWDAVLASEDDHTDGTEPIEAGADAVVPKDQYCKRCEFFSEPPDVACTRPGTEIEELVGIDEFRVTNCPVVVRRGRVRDVFADEIDGEE
jgi:hypothetical protein